MKPEELSRELRYGTGGFLRRRRQVAALSLGAMVPMGVVALYQLGIIDHVPEPPLPGLDGDRVDAAPEAYAMLSTPAAVLGLASYAVTLGLAAMGGEDRANEKPWLPLALAAKVAFDAFEAGKLNAEGWREHGAFCFWCLLSAGSTFARRRSWSRKPGASSAGFSTGEPDADPPRARRRVGWRTDPGGHGNLTGRARPWQSGGFLPRAPSHQLGAIP